MKRRIVCLCLALLLLLPMVLTGCGEDAAKPTRAFKENYNTDRPVNGLVAENDAYSLQWLDNAEDNIQYALLYDKVNNKYYSTAPYEYCIDEAQKENMTGNGELYNMLRIKYIERDFEKGTSSIEKADSWWDSVYEGGFSSELLEDEDGVRLTYNFPGVEITVAVELRLTKTGLDVRVPLGSIRENEKLLYEVALTPYFASVANEGGGYVMVPSGSGALIPAKNLEKGETTYTEAVYGNDAAETKSMIKHSQNQVHLPVFGSSDNGKGVLGIIDNGAACGYVNAVTGNSDIGYTAAYASFRIRGKEDVILTNTSNNSSSAETYSQTLAGYKYVSVLYQPLKGDASYVDMANTYRQHLISEGYLTQRPESVPALSVNFLGATQVTESFFGIPYQADVATTTLAQTQSIAAELKEMIGDKQLLATLSGYGKGGLADVTIGGDFKLSKTVGDKKNWNALLDFAKSNNTVLALDYNLVKFQKGSAGFGTGSAAAYTLSHLDAEVGTYILHTGLLDEDGLSWYLLSRSKLESAMGKAIAAGKKLGLSAVSFNSLSNTAYSDYRAARNTARAQMDKDVAAQLKACGKQGLSVVSHKANAYAALESDYIVEIPTRSSQYNVFSEEIPFYALVFQGYKGLTSASINTAVNVRSAFLDAVSVGATLQFTLCDTHHDALQFEEDTAYISSRYSDWKADIAAMVEESAALYEKIAGQAITAYTQAKGLSTTTFENGVTVYVNYTDAPMTCPLGTVPAMGFVYG